MLKMKLRKSIGKDGKLNICNLSDFDMHQLGSFLGSIPSALLNKGDTKLTSWYTGCSRSATGFIDDFIRGYSSASMPSPPNVQNWCLLGSNP